MGTVQKLAEKVKEGLQTALPKLRKTVINKLALAVGAMIEAQTPNTIELANVLPVPTERQEIREQWLRRLLNADFHEGESINILASVKLRGTGRPREDFATTESFGLAGQERLPAGWGCGCVCQSAPRSAPAQSRLRHWFPRICDTVV